MMVTFVSQCEKKALNRTRRVLDSFANRIGDNTWQTVITNEGLSAVKKLLRKTASKNTAVSCHWIRSRSRSELVWVVGKRDKFDEQGVVPVNTTKKNHQHLEWERGWLMTEVIAVASGIAGLFHDVGKANDLFQNKLDPEIQGKNFEPYRHEWVSLRLFQAFIDKNSDKQWIIKLANVDAEVEKGILHRLVADEPQLPSFTNPFEIIPESARFARLVAWLIVSHHRLPVYPSKEENGPRLSKMDNWMSKDFDNLWNSDNCLKSDWTEEQIKSNWSFSSGTPFRSKTWQQKAAQISKRAVRCTALIGINWFDKPFMMHISRLTLMLSDHYYSAGETTAQWQDSNYQAYANTNKNRQLKQKLDEHNVGVGHYAYLFARSLPRFRDELPCISDNRVLRKGLGGGKEFQWQDKAYQTAVSLHHTAQTQGFFGINMASTGKGKTIANARIMYGLSDEKEGCRISIALGLRTLTLQTGKSLKERLALDEGDIATLIGSQAVLKLSQINQEDYENKFSSMGSESLDLGADDDGYEVIYDIDTYEGLLDKWFKNNPKNQKLLHAPILVSTIDHLTPATEGVRGGRQIVPMLRLLTSDLILDEPDEFDLNDLPALARLVNWAGMLGAKVLLSTATMPPALAYGLFEAYQEGRKSYQAATSSDNSMKPIVCAWFDELDSKSSEPEGIKNFIQAHAAFVSKRIKGLEKTNLALRRAQLLDMPVLNDNSHWPLLSEIIQENMRNLHAMHNEEHESGKKVSIGLVRMANINPLVAVAKELYKREAPENHKIHYCVYHSQYPLAQRALIEDKLDQVLDRNNPQAIWDAPEIKQALRSCPEQNHLFVVLATSVAEIGRDHDYDWAVAEPSSMRSIIQLAGRIQRHRKQKPETANLYILNKNIRALSGREIAFAKPGFEAKNRKLTSHDLHDILEVCQYSEPNSKPSIQIPKKLEKQAPFSNLVMMEHMAYREKLLGDNNQENNARLWWKNQVSWCAELQRRQPFRASFPEQAYCLYVDKNSDAPVWKIKNENVSPVEYAQVSNIEPKDITIGNGNQPWFDTDIQGRYEDLSKRLGMSLAHTSRCFGEVRLREYEDQVITWYYSPLLGVFREV